MKYWIVVLAIGLNACGPGGGGTSISNVQATPTPAPSGCKDLRSQWISTTDQEVHNFVGMPFTSASFTAYNWTGYNGTACIQSAQLYAGNSVVTNAGFHYVIEFQNNSPPVGCNFWQDGSGPSATHGSALIRVECTKITLCKDINGLPAACQEFN